MATTFIYLLSDPDTREIRYVGKTINSSAARLRSHLSAARRPKSYVAKWVKSLVEAGKKPAMLVIDQTEGDWQTLERSWIKHFRTLGARLANIADGGDGSSGFSHTEEAKRKISAASTGRKASPEAIEKMRKRVVTDETRRKISDAKRGKVVISQEQREKISATLRGRRLPEETRAKMRAKVISEEHRRKISEGNKRYWAARNGGSQE